MRRKANDIETTFRVFLPAKQIRETLGLKRNKGVFLDEYLVTLKNRGQQTMVTVESSDGFSDDEMGAAEVRMRLKDHLVDNLSISRVEAILALNPNSKFFKSVLEDLKNGDPLGGGAEAILYEVEDRIANPDPQIEALLESALAIRPRSSFLNDLKAQFEGGRELSDAQIQAVQNIVNPQANPQANPKIEAQSKLIQDAFSRQPNSAFLGKLKAVLDGGRVLSDAQIKVVQDIINPPQIGVQSELIEEALSHRPNDRFLGKLKAVLDGGRTLSPKQLAVVKDIISESEQPQSDMLSDLESNGRYLSRDDYMIIRKARRNLSALTEDEAKRLRHLLYKNTNRLQGSYSRDEIRAMLKKASRTASMKELSDLRAQFEQNVNMLYSIVSELENNPVVEQHFSSEMGELLGSVAHLSNHGRGLGSDLDSALTKIESFQQEISNAFDVVRMINNRAKKLPDFF